MPTEQGGGRPLQQGLQLLQKLRLELWPLQRLLLLEHYRQYSIY